MTTFDSLGQQLAELKATIAAKDAAHKEEMTKLRGEYRQMEEQMINQMLTLGTKTVRNDTGTFSIAKRTGLNFTDPTAALAWAKEHDAVSIDKRLAAQKMKDAGEYPSFVEEVEKNTLTVKPKTDVS